MMMRFTTALAAALFAAACSSGTTILAQEAGGSAESEAKVVSPEEYLGHGVGADFKLPGWEEISGYYRERAKASPNVLLESVGETTEGRDFLVAIISGAENLARLDEIKELSRMVADPRGRSEADRRRVLERGRVIVCITPAMHASEAGGTQMGVEFARRLATSDEEPWRSARENIVVIMPPSLNPDGLDHVAEWYHETVHSPHEGSSLLKLYQYYREAQSARPHYRSWSHQAFHLLFRALLLDE